VAERHVARLVDVLVQMQRPVRFAQKLGKLALALLERCATQIPFGI
jgi:hypothetical protein